MKYHHILGSICLLDVFFVEIEGVKKTLLVSVDHYSDNFELNQLKDLRPTTVIQACKRNFRSNGIGEVICTNNGTNFINKEMIEFSKVGILTCHLVTTPSSNKRQG